MKNTFIDLSQIFKVLNIDTSLFKSKSELYSELENRISSLIESNNQLTQLHWFLTQIVSENKLDDVSLLSLNVFFEILKPDACSIYLVDSTLSVKQFKQLNKNFCDNFDSCRFIQSFNLKTNKKSSDINICKNTSCKFNKVKTYPFYNRSGSILGYLVAYYADSNIVIPKDKTLLLDVFSIQVGLSIENVIMRNNMRTLAFTDELTNLANKRMLFENIKREIARFKSNSTDRTLHKGIGLIMMDVDNFKHYNDSFGHPAGDVVLQHIGHIINSTISAIDTGARYGGEEFCILLPDKTLQECIDIADNIRKQVASTIFEYREVTISLGVSHYPTDPLNTSIDFATDLIQTADTYLYHSKNTGKNKVTCSLNLH